MASLSKFTKPEIFRRFNPVLLAEFLGHRAGMLKACGIDLPVNPTENNMPYDRIAQLFLSIDESLIELYDAINLVSTLASNKGRGAVFAAAKNSGVQLPLKLSSPYDVALWTWLHYPQVAERAGYRLKMHSVRSFHYFASCLEGKTPPLEYTQAHIELFANRMSIFYRDVSKGGAVTVLDVREGDELWLLIRHGGYLERRGDVDDRTGEVATVCFRDEEYDVLIYNTRCHELKIRNTAGVAMTRMRMEFGQVFFGSSHTFIQRESFPLSKLCEADHSWFKTVKVPGIRDVKLTEVRYLLPGSVTKTVHEKADDLLQSFDAVNGGILPGHVLGVNYAKFRFRFEGERKGRAVELFPPNKSCFARESDAPKVEEWLRSAALLRGGDIADPDERFFKALNVHLGQSYTMNEWKTFFGNVFDRIEPFLLDTGRTASYWCAQGSARRFDVLCEGETFTVLSPDYANSPELERRSIDPGELKLLKLCPCSLSARLSRSLGIDCSYCFQGDGIYRLGTLRGPDSCRHRAFLLAHAERSPVSLAKQVVGQEGEGILIATPSFCPDTSDLAEKSRLFYVPLRDMLRSDLTPVETFDESLKQFFAVFTEKELLSQDQIAGVLALAQALDEGSSRLQAPTHAAVLKLYCMDGLSIREIEKKCGCSHGTVMSRKNMLEKKLGRPLNELRTYSSHFEKISETLSDSRAAGYDARKAIYDDAAYDGK